MPTDSTGASFEIVASADRFTVLVDGRDVGHVAVTDRGDRRVFPHTEVDPAFGGRGLATAAIVEALDATRAAGLRVVPLCPMVAAYIEKHPEYADLVAARR